MIVEAMTDQELRWEVFCGAKAEDVLRWSAARREWRQRLEMAHRTSRGPRPDRLVGRGELPTTATGRRPTSKPCRKCGQPNNQPCRECDQDLTREIR